jgi:hypothetical protein
VKNDTASWTHEAIPQFEVASHAIEPMVTVNEQEIDRI